jgi:hypothetical protein
VVAAPPEPRDIPAVLPADDGILTVERADDEVPTTVTVVKGGAAPGGTPRPTPRRLGPTGRKGPRFTDDATAAPRRQPTNRAVVVYAVLAGLAAVGWLATFLGLANLSLATVPIPLLAMVFLGSVFGGMCASSLTGVARFRHSLYAGLWVSGVLLVVVVPLALLLRWMSSGMQQIASATAGEEEVLVLGGLQRGLGIAALCLFLVPLLTVAGFLLGGALDVMVTAAVRGLASRERWTYHTRDGKSFPVYGPWRNPVLAAVWSTIGWAVLVTCWVPLLYDSLLGVLAAVALGQTCRTLARKRRGVSAKAALAEDRRPPIVYLRSFQDDGVFQPGTFFLVNDWLRTLSEKTAEDNLSHLLEPFGPVVAIGRPEEEMPEVGAARIYVGDDHWQDLIVDLLSDRGALAVLQAGGTRGLQWELETVAAMLRPEQVLLFLPFALHWSRARRDAGYAGFRAWASGCFPAELPDTIDDRVYFFYFSSKPGWTTRAVEAGARVPEGHPLRSVLTDLKTGNGLRPWRLVNWRRFFLLILCALVLMPVSYGVKSLRNSITNSRSPSTLPETSETKRVDPNPAPPVVPPGGMAHAGKAFPYRLALGPGWERVPDDDPQIDLKVKRGDDVELTVVGGRDREDLDDYDQTYVKGLAAKEDPGTGKKRFDAVRLTSSRKVRVHGKDWLDFEVELRVREVTVRQHVRSYSGPEGALILLGTLRGDDAGPREELEKVLNAVEILPAR